MFCGLNAFSKDILIAYLPQNIYQNTRLLIHGDTIQSSYKLQAKDNSFCIVMNSEGQFVELNKKEDFTYQSLVDLMSKHKLTLTPKVRYMFGQLFKSYKNVVRYKESVYRCQTSLVGDKVKIYYLGIPLKIYWENLDPEKDKCPHRLAILSNLFNEELFSDTIKNSINRYTLNLNSNINNISDPGLLFKVCHSNGCSEGLYRIDIKENLLLKSQYDQFVKNINQYSPLTKIYLRYSFFLCHEMYSYIPHEAISLHQFKNHPGIYEFYEYSIRKGLHTKLHLLPYQNLVEKD